MARRTRYSSRKDTQNSETHIALAYYGTEDAML